MRKGERGFASPMSSPQTPRGQSTRFRAMWIGAADGGEDRRTGPGDPGDGDRAHRGKGRMNSLQPPHDIRLRGQGGAANLWAWGAPRVSLERMNSPLEEREVRLRGLHPRIGVREPPWARRDRPAGDGEAPFHGASAGVETGLMAIPAADSSADEAGWRTYVPSLARTRAAIISSRRPAERHCAPTALAPSLLRALASTIVASREPLPASSELTVVLSVRRMV